MATSGNLLSERSGIRRAFNDGAWTTVGHRQMVHIVLTAQIASLGLDEDRSRLYFDLVLSSLSEAARRALQIMDPAKYEYQSEFARRYVAQGRVEGRAEGRMALLIRQLTLRFGPLPDAMQARISAAPVAELDAIGERLLTVATLQEAFGSE